MKGTTVAKLLVSGLAIGYVLTVLQPARLLDALAAANPAYIALGLALKAIAVLASVAMWHSVLAPGLARSLRGSARVYASSLHAGLVGPGNLAGDAYRVAALGLKDAHAVIASLLGERTLSFAGLAGVAALGAWLVPAGASLRAPLTILALLGVGGVLVGALLGPWLAARLQGPGFVRRTATAWAEGMAALRRPGHLGLALAGLVALPLLTAASTWALFAAVGAPLPVAFTIFASCASALVVLLPISVQGVGVREGAFLLLFTGLGGVPATLSVAASLLSLATGVALGLLAGVPHWLPARSKPAVGQTAFRAALPLLVLAQSGVGDALGRLLQLLRALFTTFSTRMRNELDYLPPGSAPLVMIFGGLFVLALALMLSLLRPYLSPSSVPQGAVATGAVAAPAPAPGAGTIPMPFASPAAPMPPLPANLHAPPAMTSRTLEDGQALGRALPTPDLDSVLDAAERLGLGQAHVVSVEPQRQLVRLAQCQTCRLRPAPGAGPPECAFELGFLQAAMRSADPKATVHEVFCALAADGACEFEIRTGG
ncbi:MAG: lysylphosphatidylglycerol synthase domain-containing protein [Halobacteriales archaeon]|nr:lysylphosphatidylglycerol synthase domain-containing protein [Halobacteriales archaeon]